MKILAAVAVFVLGFQLAQAATISGSVVAVADGDTVTVLDSNYVRHKVRVAGIDAPEKSQPFGGRSKRSLSALAYGKEASVEWKKKDRYGRIVGKVLVRPADCRDCSMTFDVGMAQLSTGMAWWYRKYAAEQSTDDRERYEAVELQAREEGQGLWRDAEPVPPWEWRRRGSMKRTEK
jgi:endonuclease YncB( thermonuclease family)